MPETKPMRLLVVSAELPFPANHGGKVDIWNRLLALKAAGAEIYLVCWVNPFIGEQINDAVRDAIGQVASGFTVFELQRVFSNPLPLLRYPANTAIRRVDANLLKTRMAAIRDFNPEAVFVDQLNGGLLAMQLCRNLGLPLFYRSHNIEHRYVRGQFLKARTLRQRLVGLCNLFTTRRFEESVLRTALRFYDISLCDLTFWRARGFSHGDWLPPIMEPAKAMALSATPGWQPAFDVGYVGNLYAPNNVAGLMWFIETVWPLIKVGMPGVRAFVAGARPVPEVKLAAATAGIVVVDSPPDVVPWLRNARVIVNPIFVGSGVNIKSIEMLFTPARLVSTAVGVQGLPEQAQQQFAIAETADTFAQAVLSALAGPAIELTAGRNHARADYSVDRARALLVDIEEARSVAIGGPKPDGRAFAT